MCNIVDDCAQIAESGLNEQQAQGPLTEGLFTQESGLPYQDQALQERGAHSNGKVHMVLATIAHRKTAALWGEGRKTAKNHPESAFGWALIGWVFGRLLNDRAKIPSYNGSIPRRPWESKSPLVSRPSEFK